MLVDFYHLASSPLERVLPQICEKVLESGERLLVVGDAPLMDSLDTSLWGYERDAFLPHGKGDGAAPENQPVLLATTVEPANGAANVALADGRWREEALSFERVFYFFDSTRLDDARTSWKALKDRPGTDRRYWKQDDRGKWVQGP